MWHVCPMNEPLPNLTTGEAAKRLGVSVATLRRYEAQGKISARRTPGGSRRFSQADIDALREGAA